jgi:hypothetical protein
MPRGVTPRSTTGVTMDETRVLLVYPGSLYGGSWAEGPRVKPELVGLSTEVRRAGFAVEVLDLEAELGGPDDDAAREAFLRAAEERLNEREADLVVLSCWSALQFSATVAIAERVRRLHPDAVIAVEGYHVSARPDDFAYDGAPYNWLIVGEAESAVVTVARAVAAGDRDTSCARALEGTPLALDAEHLPDYAAYPYSEKGLPSLGVFLSRGCPYNAPACMLRPGGGGWHAYPPDVALGLLESLAGLAPGRIDVLDPAFGYEAAWRRLVLDRLAVADRRDLSLSVAAKPGDLTRQDIDKLYQARLRLRLDVGTLSEQLLSRTGQAPSPRRSLDHALDLLAYINAKGLVTTASFTFNQPGETRASAAETLDALERFVDGAPNTPVTLVGESWAFLPAGEPAADVEAPAQRYGTVIAQPEWWKQPVAAEAAARAVVASDDLAAEAPGFDGHWRPRFEELRARLAGKLTAEARRGLRSHETVGSEAYGVPHGWWAEPGWH